MNSYEDTIASSPNNRLQADRSPRAALRECKKTRLGRGG